MTKSIMNLNNISNDSGFKRGQLSLLKIPQPTPFNDRQLFIEVMLHNAGINPHKRKKK